MKGGDREFRVKDLHDIARILRARPAADATFWTNAGHEFQLACESRLVDCRGLESFMENWPLARERYETDRSLVNVSFDEAESALKTVVDLLEKQGIFYDWAGTIIEPSGPPPLIFDPEPPQPPRR